MIRRRTRQGEQPASLQAGRRDPMTPVELPDEERAAGAIRDATGGLDGDPGEVRRLEQLVAVLHGANADLREELAARRREVQQLHALLQGAQRAATPPTREEAPPPPAADHMGVAAETVPGRGQQRHKFVPTAGRRLAGELVGVALMTVLTFLTIRVFVQNFRVGGASMEPTLQPGQFLLIDKTAYFHVDGTPLESWLPTTPQGSVEYLFGGPQRGDVVVFRASTARNREYVKRVIGLPGDTVAIKHGDVFVNGRPVDEPYVESPLPENYTYPKNGRPVRVPDGKYFVLGDNRPDSSDSRQGWFVPVEDLVGRAWLSYWPPAVWGIVRHEPLQERPIQDGAEPGPAAAVGTPAPLADAAATPAAGTTPRLEPTEADRASPAAVAQPAPTPSASPRTILDEHFADGRRDWPDDPRATAYVADGAYRLVAREPGRFVAVGAPIAEALGDVVVTGTFRKVGGPPGGGYGLIVRDQGAGARDGIAQEGQFYVLEVGDRGELGIWRRDGDRWIELLPWTTAEAVRPGGATNELTVRAIGPRLTFLVNGVEVASLDDSALPDGGVGVFLGGDFNEGLVERLVVQVP